MNAFVNLLEPNRLPCMTKVWIPQIPNKKDRYLTPEELKQNVLQSPRIIALINEVSILLLIFVPFFYTSLRYANQYRNLTYIYINDV